MLAVFPFVLRLVSRPYCGRHSLQQKSGRNLTELRAETGNQAPLLRLRSDKRNFAQTNPRVGNVRIIVEQEQSNGFSFEVGGF